MNPSSEDMWTGKRRLKLAQATLEDNDVPSDHVPRICIDLRSPPSTRRPPEAAAVARQAARRAVRVIDFIVDGEEDGFDHWRLLVNGISSICVCVSA